MWVERVEPLSYIGLRVVAKKAKILPISSIGKRTGSRSRCQAGSLALLFIYLGLGYIVYKSKNKGTTLATQGFCVFAHTEHRRNKKIAKCLKRPLHKGCACSVWQKRQIPLGRCLLPRQIPQCVVGTMRFYDDVKRRWGTMPARPENSGQKKAPLSRGSSYIGLGGIWIPTKLDCQIIIGAHCRISFARFVCPYRQECILCAWLIGGLGKHGCR